MRFFLIIANTVFLFGLLFFFRQEMRGTTWADWNGRIDWLSVSLFFSVVALTCLNVGYIVLTRTDNSVITRVKRFARLWKQSADPS